MALRFEDMLERLGEQGRAAVMHTYELWQAGHVSRETFLEVTSSLLELITQQAHVYGHLSYAEVAALITDRAADPGAAIANMGASGQTASRINQSLATILDGDPEQVVTRLQRIGLVLPIEETQSAYGKSLRADPEVEGWKRGLDDSACQLCRWWWREGRIWPKDHPMPTHKGCKCQQVPTMAANIESTGFTRARRRREEALLNRDKGE